MLMVIIFYIGSELFLICEIENAIRPSIVEWLQNDVTIDYKSHLSAEYIYNRSLLTTTLTISDITQQDLGLYKCTVNTTFGYVYCCVRVAQSISKHEVGG